MMRGSGATSSPAAMRALRVGTVAQLFKNTVILGDWRNFPLPFRPARADDAERRPMSGVMSELSCIKNRRQHRGGTESAEQPFTLPESHA